MINKGQIDSGSAPPDLLLTGYMPLQRFGYALPCFGSAPNANTVYSARCSIPGDHRGLVTGFDQLDDPNVAALPPALVRPVLAGSPWTDVFLWDGEVFVGTSEELWVQLTPLEADLATRAPMSGYDLVADDVGDERRREMAKAAVDYLTARFGDAVAGEWVSQTAGSRLAVLAARHGVDIAAARFDIRRAAQPVADITGIATPETAVGREGFFAAVSSLAEDLGVTIIALSNPAGATEAGARPADRCIDPALHVLVLTAGPRAEEIAAAARPLEWMPDWDDDDIKSWMLDGGPDAENRELGRIQVDVRASGAAPEAENYAAVVVLVDDEIADDPGALERLAEQGRRCSREKAALVLAPALPKDRPSSVLTETFARNAGIGHFDFVLDTSVVRSPLRRTRRRLSLERRLADHAFGIATLLAGAAPVHLWTVRAAGGRTPMVSFTVQRPETFSSESHQDEGRAPLAGEVFDVISPANRRRDVGDLFVVRQNLNFEAFALSVLQNGHATELARLNIAPAMPEHEVRDLFAVPTLCAGFVAPPELRLCLVAEAPTLPALQSAARLGWVAIRYSDALALDRFLTNDDDRQPGFLPDDIRIPPAPRLPENRRLATRGVDPRDALIMSQAVWEECRRGRATPLEKLVRPYVERVGSVDAPDRLVIPAGVVAGLSPTDPVAKEIGRRLRSGPIRAKRTEDMNTAWRVPSPGLHRFVIEDGRLPPRVMRIADDHVPAQGFFLLDADPAAASLFRSRVFEVWARATRSRGTGWMPRFSMTGTFETFPILEPFEVVSSGTARGVRLSTTPHRTKALTDLASAQAAVDGSRGQEDAPFELEIRRIYGVKAGSTDLDILDRLNALSRERSGG